jgi:L-serine dehydratase
VNIFDILGPVMVGPSSSHTAGAARIGYVARQLLGEKPVEMEMLLHGSFAATGEGHGTDRALIGGVLGLKPDDTRLTLSRQLAAEQGLEVSQSTVHLRYAHPNSVLLTLKGEQGATISVEAASLGGGRISITGIDGIKTNFHAECPTIIVKHQDKPGQLKKLIDLLAYSSINVGNMHTMRHTRGGMAIVVIECDQNLSQQELKLLHALPGIEKLTYLPLEEGDVY